MVVLGLVAGLAGPLTASMSRAAGTQSEARRALGGAAYALQRIDALLRASLENSGGINNGIDTLSATSIACLDGEGVSLIGSTLYLVRSGVNNLLLEDVDGFTVSAVGADGVADAMAQPGNAQLIKYALTVSGLTLAGATAVPVPPASGGAAPIGFDPVDIVPYGPSQDGSGGRETTAQVLDSGATLYLYGNAWKAIAFPYTVTDKTIIEFDFASTIEGEIHGVFFSSDLIFDYNEDKQRGLAVYGTQDWLDISPPDVPVYAGAGAYESYSVNLKSVNPSFPLGSYAYLVFVMDADAGPLGDSYFRNVRVYEGP